MGLVLVCTKTLLSVGFLLIAGGAYTLGIQRDAIENSNLDESDRLNFVTATILKRDVVNAIEAGSVSEGHNFARRLAVMSPVDELPYEAALANAVAEGDADDTRKFALQALKRQPRSLAARLYLFRAAAESKDLDQLIAQYQRLVELRSLNRHVLSDALIGAVRHTGDWSTLLEYLESNPHTAGMLIDRLIREPNLPLQFQEVLKSYPDKQARYINRVMRDDGLKAAFLAWQSFSNQSNHDTASLPFNGDLSIRPEPAPFNWLVKSDLAEFQRSGGLYVSFPGRGNPTFIEQIFAAPAGSYTLRSEVIGRMPENGGALEWQLTCMDTGQLISTSTLSLERSSTLEIFESDIEIPLDACDFQKLELRGRAGAFPKTSRTEILSVSLITVTRKSE